MQWLQDTNQSNVDNLKNVSLETRRYCMNKQGEIWKLNLMSLKQRVRTKNIRDSYMDINGFKNGYQRITDIVKNDKVYQVLDTHRIMSKWRNHFSQLLNISWINVVRDGKTYSRATSA